MSKLALAVSLALGCSAVYAATVYTGDKLQGVPVISQLDIADLAPGKTYRFMFQGATDGLGQPQYLPVIVTKGAKAGPKLVLNSGNHGDEVNGIRAIQKIMAGLDANKLAGSVVAVTGSNPNAINRVTRNWLLNNDGGETVNFNRVFPGKEQGTAPEQQAWLLWNKLWKGNVDYALDFHTQSTGTDYPFFIYADYRDPRVERMAELFPADQIKKDPGDKGTTETEFVATKIPALTLELGSPRKFDTDMIDRGVEGTRNVMIDLKMMEGKIGRTAKTEKTFIGNDMTTVRAEQGGYAEVLVKLGDTVKKDQVVARQLNVFGDTVKEYKSPANGKVLSTGTDAVREPKATLVRILFQNPDPKCKLGC